MDFIPNIVALVIAITIHEFCHAWVANYLGDPTAKYEGRLSLNPLVHLDPVGTIMLLLVHFGWGKPVPFNPYYLKNPRLGSFLISLSGPVSNFLLALLVAIPLKYVSYLSPLYPYLSSMYGVNLLLFIFNLFPIHPLDGAKVFRYFVPHKFDEQMDEYFRVGPYILLTILLFEYVTHISIIGTVIYWVAEKISILLSVST